MIDDGCTVTFEYIMTLVDGSVIESNVGKTPFSYVHGEDGLLPEVQEQLLGHVASDVIEFQLAPEKCFGPVQPDLFKEVPIREIPKDAREIGARLKVGSIDGPVRVSTIHENTIELNFNHRLAGEDLNFSVRVLAVDAAPVGI